MVKSEQTLETIWSRTVLALHLHYTAEDAATLIWAKSPIYSALEYLILPIYAIPDMLPGIGLSNDIAVMSATLATSRLM